MAMVVNHNIPALQTYNTLTRTNNALEKSIQKLSTGLRINSAADDAAGLAISEKMRAQINGLDRAVSNAQDGISMIQTAEGALNETHSILQRMRELSVQAANDTLTSQDRGYIQLEIDELREEVTRIGNTTQFNKKKLLNGDAAVLWSSSDLSTKAVVNGGLRSIDQFGQKVVTEGNYNITIKADPGQAEVQKSDIFKIKHENVVTKLSANTANGATDVEVKNMPAGSYTIKGANSAPASAQIGGVYNVAGQVSKAELTFELAGSAGAALTKAGTYKITVGDSSNTVVEVSVESGTYGANTSYGVKSIKVNGTEWAGDGKASWTGSNVASQTQADLLAAIKTGVNNASWGTGVTKDFDTTSNVLTLSKQGGAIGKVTATFGDEAKATAGEKDGSTVDPATITDVVKATVDGTALVGNANLLFEVTDVNASAGTVTLKMTGNILKEDGSTATVAKNNIVLTAGASSDLVIEELGTKGTGSSATYGLGLKLDKDLMSALSKGSKFVYNLTSASGNEDFYVQVSGDQETTWDDNWINSGNSGTVTRDPVTYAFADSVAGQEIHFKNYYLDEKTGDASIGEIVLSTNSNFTSDNIKDDTAVVATFDAAYVGQVAEGDVKLRDLDKFWTSEGVFMLDDPQTITITQGDGTQASFTLYATDTLNDVQEKLNTAIGKGLGQASYVDDGSHFATFVTTDNAESGIAESVPGTFIIRSVVPGESGTLSFSGSEDIINAFSLNQLQSARESTYTVDVLDAHTDEVLKSDVKVTGNKLVGVIHPNVDVVFDAMSGVSATWNSDRNAYVYNENTTGTTTTLHLSDNTTVFQIGANEGEDMGVHIGDMRATALGLDSVNVMNRESASRSITILDNAIDKVSTQRAKLGAYQNRLEHTINNLNTAAENITSAESRIRDTDMAKEMMNFTKLQIMLQAGTSMLAQANQLPQNVLSLVR